MERRRGTRRCVGLSVVALCAVWAAPASAQVKVGEPDAVKPVAYGGVQSWLRQVRVNGRQVQRLVLRVNGVVADAPIKPLASLPGIDLGPGAVPGSVVAAYTRCTGGLFHERCSILGAEGPVLVGGHGTRYPARAQAVSTARATVSVCPASERHQRAASAPHACSVAPPVVLAAVISTQPAAAWCAAWCSAA